MAHTSLKWLALLGGLVAGTTAFAQDSGPLIDALVKKGILNDQEAEELRVDLQKDFAESSAGKLNVSSSIKELKISGDARVRFEQRSGEAGVVSGATKIGDTQERDRFRYRFRLSLTGKLADGWFFGSRLETATGNRSTNVTAANYPSGTSPNQKPVPFGKDSSNGIYLGQLYIGRSVEDFTFTAGRFANPMVSTPMVWDDDINVEGLAEQWNYAAGNVTWMANLGQFLYEGSGTVNSFGSSAGNRDWSSILAFQGGAKVKTSSTTSVQVLPTYYYYTNSKKTTGNLTFDPLTSPNSASLRPEGLSIVDIPVEFGFKLGSLPAKIWVDYAINLDAEDRATAAGKPTFDGEDTAWQVGFGVGQTKVKGDWEAKVFYQVVDAFALDSNLVDSDLFDSRTNMEGYGVSFAYVLTTGVTAKLTYAAADRKEDALATYGSGDIGTASVKNYNLLQVDLNVKF